MKELAAKKLGEAVALCGLGAEMLKMHEKILLPVMNKDTLDEKRQKFEEHTKRSREVGQALGMGDSVEMASRETLEMFTQMHETFMGDDMDNPMKAVAWLNLSAAGGLSIWVVLEAAGEKLDQGDLTDLSHEAIEFQKQNLEDGEMALRELAEHESVEE